MNKVLFLTRTKKKKKNTNRGKLLERSYIKLAKSQMRKGLARHARVHTFSCSMGSLDRL